jgi:CRP-like cAMP-binding protein
MRILSVGRVSEPSRAELRRHVERYVHPTAADYAHLWRLGQEQQVAPKTYLSRAGEVCERVHFVVEGIARHAAPHAGKEHTVGFSLPGMVLTDVSSFFSRQPAERHLIAVTRLRTLSLTYEQVQELYQRCPVWAQCGRLITEAYTLHLTRRALSMQLKPAAARYEELLATYPELFHQVPLHQVASYLGIAKETLSRLRRRPTQREGQKANTS